MDASLRDLEREAADDPAARLKLARALERSGRSDEALAALELSTLPADVYAAGHELSERLWRAHVARLAPAHEFPARGPRHHALDWSEKWIAWTELDREGLRVAPLDGSAPAVNVLPHHPAHEPPIAFRGGFFTAFEGHVTFVRLEPEVSLERHGLEPTDEIESWSASGDRVFLRREGREGVYAWPSLVPVLERPTGARVPIVDWGLGLFLHAPEANRVEAIPFEHGLPCPLSEEVLAAPFARLGGGVIASTGAGLVLHHLRVGWSLPLVPATVALPGPDLANDRRGLRLIVGGKLVRFDVALETPRLLGASPFDLATLDEADFRRPGWHPVADLAGRSTSSGIEVFGREGPIASWEGVEDPDWIAGGRALLARRRDLGGLVLLR